MANAPSGLMAVPIMRVARRTSALLRDLLIREERKSVFRASADAAQSGWVKVSTRPRATPSSGMKSFPLLHKSRLPLRPHPIPAQNLLYQTLRTSSGQSPQDGSVPFHEKGRASSTRGASWGTNNDKPGRSERATADCARACHLAGARGAVGMTSPSPPLTPASWMASGLLQHATSAPSYTLARISDQAGATRGCSPNVDDDAWRCHGSPCAWLRRQRARQQRCR